MRWDALFGDLEAQLEAADAAELSGEVADRTRREVSTLGLLDRARAAVGRPVRVELSGVGDVAGELLNVGSQWLLVRDPAGRDVLLPWSAVVAVVGFGADAAAPDSQGQVFRRLGLSAALRAIARDRAAVSVALVDGRVLTGTIDRVGRDFVEVSEHPLGEARRPAAVRRVHAVAYRGLASVTQLL